LSMIVLMVRGPARSSRAGGVGAKKSVASATRARMVAEPALLEAPLANLRVVPREQDLRHRPAAVRRGAGVVGVLGAAAEGLRERLLDGAPGVAERPRQLAYHRVGDDHRGELAARDHIRADRDGVGRQVVADPLVDALVSAAQQRQRRLGGELAGESLVELATRRGEEGEAAG